MAIEVGWDDAEHTVILLTFSANWVWDELYEAAVIVDELTAAADHKVGYLLDLHEARRFPSGISATKIQQALNFDHPNAGLAVISGTNLFVQTMANSVVRVMGHREDFAFVQSLDEARRLIAESLHKDAG